jgi:hypothetical protein
MGILISGPALGDETRSLENPRDWMRAGPGLLSVPLCKPHMEGDLAERVAGFAYVELSLPRRAPCVQPHGLLHILRS